MSHDIRLGFVGCMMQTAPHRGLELTAVGRVSETLSVLASVIALDVTYTQVLDPLLIRQRVTNVPYTLRTSATIEL